MADHSGKEFSVMTSKAYICFFRELYTLPNGFVYMQLEHVYCPSAVAISDNEIAYTRTSMVHKFAIKFLFRVHFVDEMTILST